MLLISGYWWVLEKGGVVVQILHILLPITLVKMKWWVYDKFSSLPGKPLIHGNSTATSWSHQFNLYIFVTLILQALGISTLCLQIICTYNTMLNLSSRNYIKLTRNSAINFLLMKEGSCIKTYVGCWRFHMVPLIKREEANLSTLTSKNQQSIRHAISICMLKSRDCGSANGDHV